MLSRIFLSAISIFLLIQTILSQNTAENQQYNGLQVGDRIPADLLIGRVINGKISAKTFYDLRGKAVIIDFWATWCAPCVKALPKLDSIQKKFKDELVVLPVVEARNESKKIVSPFLEKYKMDLATVIDDTTLEKLFPHQLIPHEVWIDKTGTIVSITGDQEVSEANVLKLLSGDQMTLNQKKDRSFDWSRPLFYNGNGGTIVNPVFVRLIRFCRRTARIFFTLP